jgi:hypothetical protein
MADMGFLLVFNTPNITDSCRVFRSFDWSLVIPCSIETNQSVNNTVARYETLVAQIARLDFIATKLHIIADMTLLVL